LPVLQGNNDVPYAIASLQEAIAAGATLDEATFLLDVFVQCVHDGMMRGTSLLWQEVMR
jgi:hypothetical protein